MRVFVERMWGVSSIECSALVLDWNEPERR